MATFEDYGPHAKRRKIQNDIPAAPAPPAVITSHQQLRAVLTFQQSVSPEVKQGTDDNIALFYARDPH